MLRIAKFFVYLQISSRVIVVVVCVHDERWCGPTKFAKCFNHRRPVRWVHYRCLYQMYARDKIEAIKHNVKFVIVYFEWNFIHLSRLGLE